MAHLPVQRAGVAGAELDLVATDEENTFPNNGGVVLVVANGAGSPVQVTFETARAGPTGEPQERVVSVPAGETHIFGPFATLWFNDEDGNVHFVLSDETSVTATAIGV